MVIRSYRRVFDLERRIYRVTRIRLNPGGIPIRGVVYLLALVVLAANLRTSAFVPSPTYRLPLRSKPKAVGSGRPSE